MNGIRCALCGSLEHEHNIYKYIYIYVDKYNLTGSVKGLGSLGKSFDLLPRLISMAVQGG